MLHGRASGTYPFLASMKPKDFVRLLSAAEITLGSALLLPIVPGWLAGLDLTAFSGGLVGLYLRTQGMTREGSVLPTQQGIALAKDTWMLGIGLSLVIYGITERS